MTTPAAGQKENRAKLVKKSWGQEEWIVNTTYCGKRMTLRGGEACSWHYHKDKDETFYVEEGTLILRLMPLEQREKLLKEGYNEEEIFRTSSYQILGPGDSCRIRPGTIHRFEGLLDTIFFEFSTHHKDSDTYRIPLVSSPSFGCCQC